MLGEEAPNSSAVRGSRKFIQRSVAFAQSDDVALGLGGGEKFAESPHAAEIERQVGRATLMPNGFQVGRAELSGSPRGVSDFKKIAALRAAKIQLGCVAERATADAVKAKGG